MSATFLLILIEFVLVTQPFFLVYFVLHNSYTLWLIGLSAQQVRRRVAGHFIEDLDLIDERDLTKPLTMIVPAYNEEVTIVDSVTGLIHCDYPRFEIVVVPPAAWRTAWSRSNARSPWATAISRPTCKRRPTASCWPFTTALSTG